MVGGTEDYLTSLVEALESRGYSLAFVTEVDSPENRVPIDLPRGTPDWCVEIQGISSVLASARAWKPELIYCHGPLDFDLESALLDLAPAVYFAHNYYGTCISGYKAHQFPTPRPCSRVFGVPCLFYYFPRRCGGRSPLTMFRYYNRERKRLQNLKRYRFIVTHSQHMRTEYLKNGLPPEKVLQFRYEVETQAAVRLNSPNLIQIGIDDSSRSHEDRHTKRILFLGRMEKLKGGQALIDASSFVQQRLGAPVEVTFGGDGPEKERWRKRSQRISSANGSLKFIFPGWLNPRQVSEELAKTDVLAVPSLWPEPFGRVGIQAGLHSVPVAAFALGGVPEWLRNGTNGYLAPANPPTAEGLASAIIRCFDPKIIPHLRSQARALANNFSTRAHVDYLVSVFDDVVPGRLRL